MDYILDNYHNQLNANKEKFEKIYNEKISSKTDIRNIILSTITIVAGVLIAIKDLVLIKKIPDSELYWIFILIGLGIVGLIVFIVFSSIKKNQEKKLLEILKEFHDGFTTISFMKGFLYRISLEFENLKEVQQVDVLINYYIRVQGGIALQIRNAIIRYLKKEDIYGYKEQVLYTGLINTAYKLYKNQKIDEIENTLEQLFKKYDFPKLKKTLDSYKILLEKTDSLLIGGCVSTKNGKKIGQIIAIDKSHMMVKNSGKNRLENLKDYRIPLAMTKDWQYRLIKRLLREKYYCIQLKKAMIKDWQYGDSLIIEIDNSEIEKYDVKKSPNRKLYDMNKYPNEDNLSIVIEEEEPQF